MKAFSPLPSIAPEAVNSIGQFDDLRERGIVDKKLRQLEVQLKLLKCMLLTLLCLASVMASSAPAINLYEPNHKTPEQLVRAVTPVYGDEAKFSADDQQIIIRADESIVNEIQDLLLQLDHPSRVYQLEISNNPGNRKAKTYSTESRELSQWLFTLTENQPLIIARQQQTQQVNTLRPLWRTVNTIPVQQEALALNLQASKNHVYIDIQLQTLRNGQVATINSKVTGPMYEWLAVSGNRRDADSMPTTHSTHRSNISNLYIKVSPAD
ncbi:MAG: hypothetical protein V7708_13740 [Oceanicoccus sp.]